MKKTILLMTVLAATLLMFAIACGDDNPLDGLTEADPGTACGRYCIKCETCKTADLDGYVKTIMDYTCYMDQLGKVCETACDMGDSVLPLKANTEASEAATGMKITDAEFTCQDFALSVASGSTPGGVCYDFCAKCVTCSTESGVGAAADWCAKEGGLPCIKACEEGFESYVKTANETIDGQYDDKSSLADLNCTDYLSNADSLVKGNTDF